MQRKHQSNFSHNDKFWLIKFLKSDIFFSLRTTKYIKEFFNNY